MIQPHQLFHPLWYCEKMICDITVHYKTPNFISHLIGTVTTLRLASDCVVNFDNCRQSGDYTAIYSSVTALPSVVKKSFSSAVTVPNR